MQWFLNLSTRSKLSLGFGVAVLFLVTVVAVAYTGIKSVHDTGSTLEELMSFRNNFNKQRAALLTMMLTSDRAKHETLIAELGELSKESDEVIHGLRERNSGDPKFLTRLDEAVAIRNEFVKTRGGELIPFIAEGKIEEAKALAGGVQAERYQKIN